MYKYPYGDSQQLNLDWIISKIKELEAGGSGGAADLEAVANALVTLSFNLNTQYRRYDYCFLNGKLYRCLSDTSGVFDPSAWQEALIGDDLSVLTRWINAIDAAAVVDVKFDTSGTNGKIQQKYHDEYHDVVEVDYTPVQNSKRPLSSNAGYELNSAINDLQQQISTYIQTSTTATRNYTVGDYIILNGDFYRVTANIANGATIVPNTNVVASTAAGELYYLRKPLTTYTADYTKFTTNKGTIANASELTIAYNETTVFATGYVRITGLADGDRPAITITIPPDVPSFKCYCPPSVRRTTASNPCIISDPAYGGHNKGENTFTIYQYNFIGEAPDGYFQLVIPSVAVV